MTEGVGSPAPYIIIKPKKKKKRLAKDLQKEENRYCKEVDQR